MVAEIKSMSGCLGKIAGKAQQKISEGITGLGAIEAEGAIKGGVRILVDLIVMELKTGLERMLTEHLGNRIVEIESVVPLLQISDGYAHNKGGEYYVLNSFNL